MVTKQIIQAKIERVKVSLQYWHGQTFTSQRYCVLQKEMIAQLGKTLEQLHTKLNALSVAPIPNHRYYDC